MSGTDDEEMRKRFGLGLSGVKADVLGAIEQAKASGSHKDDTDVVGPVAQDGAAFGGLLPAAAAPGQMQDKIKEEAMEEEEL